MAAIREAVRPDIDLMFDLHRKFEASEAIRLIRRLEPHNLYFAEAVCQPEDTEGQARVARGIGVPEALGKEWRTVYEYHPRFEARAMGIVQPEIGHACITKFSRICAMAQAFHMRIIPHALISVGIFIAASLEASAALRRVPYHEYQHSIFDRNLRFTDGDMACAAGTTRSPPTPVSASCRTERSSTTSERSERWRNTTASTRSYLPSGTPPAGSTAPRWPARSTISSHRERTASPSLAS